VTIYGIHPVLEALRAGRVTRLHVGDRRDQRLQRLLALALQQHVRIEYAPAETLTRQAAGGVHQGVVAEVEGSGAHSIEDLVRGAAAPLIVVLDGIEDPQNMGAIVRTADAAGVNGVIVQTRRAAGRGGAAAKASAGAMAHVRIAEVVNIARAVEDLKGLGVWTVGLVAVGGAMPYDAVDLVLPTAIVVGAEGKGLRRLVRERCDLTASIPMRGHVASVNVSVATGVMLFEALRQRRNAELAGLIERSNEEGA
jgi:23S rRNA (guanosine2251-2'-O)-methyltransferase